MNLAFCLFRFFPYGGLERDFLRIAQACWQRGHQIDVYTLRWEGEKPEGFMIHLVNSRGWTNHARAKNFGFYLEEELKHRDYDAVIGFNRLPMLDYYFCADLCFAKFAAEKHGHWYSYTPRFKNYLALEKAVFEPNATTKILYITPNEKKDYQTFYKTPSERFYFIPPGIERNTDSDQQMQTLRQKIRADFYIHSDEKILLMVGSDFKRKGVDRSMRALASLPLALKQSCKLFIIGQGNIKYFLKLAKKWGISDRINFLGPRNDVKSWMLAADLLLHPAYFETAGMVIIEALTRGLPVIVTENCGYAFHVKTANAGLTIPTPFEQTQMNALLLTALNALPLSLWRKNAFNYAAKTDLYSMTDEMIKLIEKNACLSNS